MLFDQIADNQSQSVRDCISSLSNLSDEEFVKKLDLLSSSKSLQYDESVLKIFEHFGHCEDHNDLKDFLTKEKLALDRVNLVVQQFQTWKSSERFTTSVSTSDREKLIDVQWKLVVKASGSDLDKGSVSVEMQLVVEAGSRIRRHHLCMDVQSFYDLMHKLNKSNSNIQDILKS